MVWIFKHDTLATQDFRESAAVRWYRSALRAVIRYRYAFTGAGMLVLIPAAFLLARFPKDFLPDIDEGAILYMPTTLPGLPNREAGWIVQQMDKKLKAFPEVERVFGKIGRADTSTDPAPLTMIETTVLLQPKSKWRKGMTKEKLVAEMDKAAETIGYVNAWVQPIRGARDDAEHRHPDAGRHQGQGAGHWRHRGHLAADRGAAARTSRHQVRDRRAHFRRLLRRRPERSANGWPSTASPWTKR